MGELLGGEDAAGREALDELDALGAARQERAEQRGAAGHHARLVDRAGPHAVRRGTTLLIVVVGWVVFRADSIEHAAHYLQTMFTFGGLDLGVLARVTTTRAALTLIVSLLVVLLPASYVTGPFLTRPDDRLARLARFVVVGLAFPFALLLAASGAFSPFLYFQF